jgi:hypothetical protein
MKTLTAWISLLVATAGFAQQSPIKGQGNSVPNIDNMPVLKGRGSALDMPTRNGKEEAIPMPSRPGAFQIYPFKVDLAAQSPSSIAHF